MSSNLSIVVPSRKKRLFMDGSVAGRLHAVPPAIGRLIGIGISNTSRPHGLICGERAKTSTSAT